MSDEIFRKFSNQIESSLSHKFHIFMSYDVFLVSRIREETFPGVWQDDWKWKFIFHKNSTFRDFGECQEKSLISICIQNCA